MDNLINYYQDYDVDLSIDELHQTKIIFDSSALLNALKLTQENLNLFLGILKQIEVSIWMPFTVSVEVAKGVNSVVNTHLKTFDILLQSNKGAFDEMQNILKKNNYDDRHPSLKEYDLKEEYKKFYKKNEDAISFLEKEYRKYVSSNNLLEKIVSAFNGNIGKTLSADIIKKWNTEAADRFSKSLPPGYMDNAKKDFTLYEDLIITDKYCDFYIWQEIIENIISCKPNRVLFITDDSKEDWVKYNNVTDKYFPRPELKSEFAKYTSVTKFSILSLNDFIIKVSNELGVKSDQHLIDEVFSNWKEHLETNVNRLIPYVLVVFPEENQVAVYNRSYSLLRETATPELINFAIQKNIQTERFFSFSYEHQIPTWMTEEKKNRCIVYWLWKFEPDENMPKR